jgi:hypothetical protein
MVVKFRAREISRGARKLTRTLTLIIILKKIQQYLLLNQHGDVFVDDHFHNIEQRTCCFFADSSQPHTNNPLIILKQPSKSKFLF